MSHYPNAIRDQQVLRAYRPVEAGEWLDGFRERASKICGDMFDFDAVNEFMVPLVTEQEVVRLKQTSAELSLTSMAVAVELARQHAPQSFQEPASLSVAGWRIQGLNLAGDEPDRFFGLRVKYESSGYERALLTQGINRAAGRKLEWKRGYSPLMLVAGVRDHIPTEQLRKLLERPPRGITALSGIVEVVTCT